MQLCRAIWYKLRRSSREELERWMMLMELCSESRWLSLDIGKTDRSRVTRGLDDGTEVRKWQGFLCLMGCAILDASRI